MIDRLDGGTPYGMRRDQSYNPLDRILAAADLVGGGPEALAQQLRYLDDPDGAVRYWAAVGIHAARGEIGGHLPEVRQHLADPAPFVRVEIAAALYAATGEADARRALEELVLSDDQIVAHQAVEKVLYMPQRAPEFAGTIVLAKRRLEEGRHSRQCKFTLGQAIDMYLYLYADEPLYYEGMEDYLSESDRLPLREQA
jgi:hypothetical protein